MRELELGSSWSALCPSSATASAASSGRRRRIRLIYILYIPYFPWLISYIAKHSYNIKLYFISFSYLKESFTSFILSLQVLGAKALILHFPCIFTRSKANSKTQICLRVSQPMEPGPTCAGSSEGEGAACKLPSRSRVEKERTSTRVEQSAISDSLALREEERRVPLAKCH